MPGKRDPGNPDASTVQKLRARTIEAAGLIRGEASEDFKFAVRASGWEYAVLLVPCVVTRDGDPEPVNHPLHRLVVYGVEESSEDELPRRIAVLEPTAFRHKNMTVRLQARPKRGSKDAFSRAEEVSWIQFWIDLDAGLGADLRRFLSRAAQAHLGKLSADAAGAFASSIGARRKALNMNLGDLSDMTSIPAEELAQIEDGEAKATWSTLGKIQTAFDEKVRSLLDVELGGTSEVADELLGSYGVHDPGDVTSATSGGPSDLRPTRAPVVAATYGGVLPPFAEEFSQLPETLTGPVIRKIRKDSGLTLTGLSELCDLDPSHISRVERGGRLTQETARRLKGGLTKWLASQGKGVG
jgi:transcriptional regulator with XRE-family HTH domain